MDTDSFLLSFDTQLENLIDFLNKTKMNLISMN